MYLVIDCETTGLPRDRYAPIQDVDKWPRVVQLAWALYDETEKLIDAVKCLIRPNGFVIPAEVQRIHHITTERALSEGKDLVATLQALSLAEAGAEVLIAHNMEFDRKVISAEYLRSGLEPPKVISAEYPRYGLEPPVDRKKRICTMTMPQIVDYCAIPAKRGIPGKQKFKWPSLSDLHVKLFGSNFDEAHDAGADVAACARCFFELKERGVILP